MSTSLNENSGEDGADRDDRISISDKDSDDEDNDGVNSDSEWIDEDPPPKKRLKPSTNCFLHKAGLPKPGNLVKCTPKRLEDFKTVKKIRLKQNISDPKRMSDVCEKIPDHHSSNLFYHTNCAKSFTKHLDKLAVEENPGPSAHRLGRSGNSGNIILPPNCIFCGKDGAIWLKKPRKRSISAMSIMTVERQ